MYVINLSQPLNLNKHCGTKNGDAPSQVRRALYQFFCYHFQISVGYSIFCSPVVTKTQSIRTVLREQPFQACAIACHRYRLRLRST